MCELGVVVVAKQVRQSIGGRLMWIDMRMGIDQANRSNGLIDGFSDGVSHGADPVGCLLLDGLGGNDSV